MANILELLQKLDTNQKDILISKIEKDGQKYNLFPLSLAQERLWFISKFNPNSTAYNIPTALRIKGNFDLAVFEKSFQYLIDRHEVLRTSIIEIKDKAYQYIVNHLEFEYTLINVRKSKEELKDEKDIQNLIYKESQCLLNFAQSPLLRVTVFRINEDEHIILLVIHHIISDGWSINVIIKEFSSIYNSFINQQNPILPELKIQYADFSVWQRNWLQSEEAKSQLSFWSNHLKKSEYSLNLPYDFEFSNSERGPLKSIVKNIKIEKLNLIRTKLGTKEISDFMILLSAYNILLSIYCQQDEFIIGLPIANRNKLSTENVLGLFINTIVIKQEKISLKSVKELFLNIKEFTVNAFSNQDLPFEKLVEEIQPVRNLKKTPIFQTMFSFQNFGKNKIEFENLVIENYPTYLEDSKFDLILNSGKINPNEYQLSFEYDSNLFKENTIIRIANSFEKLINILPSVINN